MEWNDVDRRTYLATTAAAVSTAVAGCAGDTDENGADPTEEPDDETGANQEPEEETEEETPEPVEDGESYTFEGSGNRVTEGFEVEGGLVSLGFGHNGQSNFQVTAIDPAGNEELLVNEIGDYNGAVALAMQAGEWVLDISADGGWRAEISQPRFSESDVVSTPVEMSGQHAAWVGPFDFDGNTRVSFEIFDDSQASVWLRDANGSQVDLLHNEIGPYDGEALITQSGFGIITIDTDSAEWEIEIGD